jgi:hypothetical protein
MQRSTLFTVGLALALGPPALIAAEPSARVVVVATYHLANPGRDLNNVAAVDVLAPEHQRELMRITVTLAKFEPTFVGVEWPAAIVDERYAKYRAGELPQSRNEVVQLGFRLAKLRGLERVHGLDVSGDFPFEAVQAWAREHGRQGAIDALMADGQREVRTITAKQASGIAGALRYLNEPANIARNHAFYPAMLRMGQGDEQPGAKLLAAWYARNLEICARLVQALKPGDRAIVFFGQGHAYLLNQCLDEAPGVERLDALALLP